MGTIKYIPGTLKAAREKGILREFLLFYSLKIYGPENGMLRMDAKSLVSFIGWVRGKKEFTSRKDFDSLIRVGFIEDWGKGRFVLASINKVAAGLIGKTFTNSFKLFNGVNTPVILTKERCCDIQQLLSYAELRGIERTQKREIKNNRTGKDQKKCGNYSKEDHSKTAISCEGFGQVLGISDSSACRVLRELRDVQKLIRRGRRYSRLGLGLVQKFHPDNYFSKGGYLYCQISAYFKTRVL